MIVDPPGGRAPAHERVLVLGGWDLDDDGKNELYTWNGVAGFYHKFPLKVPVGDLVRLYVVNLVEYDPVVTFHLHAQTFDVATIAKRGLGYERLDQLMIEHLLGVRG